jgi:hypothetical protein
MLAYRILLAVVAVSIMQQNDSELILPGLRILRMRGEGHFVRVSDVKKWLLLLVEFYENNPEKYLPPVEVFLMEIIKNLDRIDSGKRDPKPGTLKKIRIAKSTE